jgi:cobalt-zinc-cadmium efflux system protein
MGDAAISLGVVIAGLIIKYTGANIIDPMLSLVISLVIAIGTWNLFKEALSLSINAVPEKVKMKELSTYLKSLKNVKEVKDLHVWAISTKEIALTAHLIMPSGNPGDEFIYEIEKVLKETFNIHHTTIQIETKEIQRPELENCYKI